MNLALFDFDGTDPSLLFAPDTIPFHQPSGEPAFAILQHGAADADGIAEAHLDSIAARASRRDVHAAGMSRSLPW
jgi:hypothetical protein